jgi:hypothetical protein
LAGDTSSGELAQILATHREWLDKYTEDERRTSEAFTHPGRADFCGAVLDGASFFLQDLRYADFLAAKLRNATFNGAKLDHANFTDADLRGADFVVAEINDSYFGRANVAGLRFEPEPGTLPSPIAIRSAQNLEQITFEHNPDGLLDLREQFRKAGRRDLERRLTYAIEHRRTRIAFESGSWVEGTFRIVAWEVPTSYDLHPERALVIALVLATLFALPYFVALSPRYRPRVWCVEVENPHTSDAKKCYTPYNTRGWRRLRRAAYICISASLELGWGQFTFASWFSRLQFTDYLIEYEGWVRFLTGLQSLLTAYLFAMWFLTYFGRLFQG